MGSRAPLIIDTNVILYEIKGVLDEPLPRGDAGISILTKVELLGYPKLGAAEEALIKDVIEQLDIWPVDDRVAVIAIALRQRYSTKVPDAASQGRRRRSLRSLTGTPGLRHYLSSLGDPDGQVSQLYWLQM